MLNNVQILATLHSLLTMKLLFQPLLILLFKRLGETKNASIYGKVQPHSLVKSMNILNSKYTEGNSLGLMNEGGV